MDRRGFLLGGGALVALTAFDRISTAGSVAKPARLRRVAPAASNASRAAVIEHQHGAGRGGSATPEAPSVIVAGEIERRVEAGGRKGAVEMREERKAPPVEPEAPAIVVIGRR